jgi:hypothetical protein
MEETESNDEVHYGKGKKTVTRQGQRKSLVDTESRSDDEPSLSKTAMAKSRDDAKNKSWDVEKPIKEGILQHDPTTEGSDDGSISKLTTEAGSGDVIPESLTLAEPNMTSEQRGISPKLMQPPSR